MHRLVGGEPALSAVFEMTAQSDYIGVRLVGGGTVDLASFAAKGGVNLSFGDSAGYTIIGNLSGKGHHGVREAHFMFSEQESLEMIMTVVPEEKVEPILAGLRPLFERHSGVMFVADVAVSRQEYFGKKGK